VGVPIASNAHLHETLGRVGVNYRF
jgi:hypothetical protein